MRSPKAHLRACVYAISVLMMLTMPGAQAQGITEGRPGAEEGTAVSDDQSERRDALIIVLISSLARFGESIRHNLTKADKMTADAQEVREIRALEAEEEMAKWAEWMFYATAVTVVMTFGALIAIVRTLHHTGRAADYTRDMLVEAKITTQAALETVKVSKDIGDRQVRPYLSFNGGKICVTHVENEGPESSYLYLNVQFKNGGHSPSILTAVSGAIYAPSGKGVWINQNSSWRALHMVIGSGQSDQVGFQTVSADALGDFSVFVIGILLWYDGLTGGKFEDHVWLYFDGKNLRQDIPFLASGWELHRPDPDALSDR